MAVICREITTVVCFLSLRCTKWSPGALSGAPTPICFTAWMTNGPHDPSKSCWTGWKGSLLPWSIPVFSPKNDQLRWSQTYMAIEKQSRNFSSIPKWSVSDQKLPIDYEGFHCHPLADCIQDGSLLFVLKCPHAHFKDLNLFLFGIGIQLQTLQLVPQIWYHIFKWFDLHCSCQLLIFWFFGVLLFRLQAKILFLSTYKNNESILHFTGCKRSRRMECKLTHPVSLTLPGLLSPAQLATLVLTSSPNDTKMS